jgi:N4-gp56 family major capsid protein
MSGATYLSPQGRINKIKGEILGHAQPTEALGITGQNKKYDKNQGDTVIYRRYLPYGGANTNTSTINQWIVDPTKHIAQEGVTPPADSITPQDITVVMQQYACLYMYTDKTADLHEDDIPGEFKEQTGERMGLVREMIRYGELKSCTNAFYAGGTSRGTVAASLTYNLLSKIARSLLANHGKQITKVLAASPNFNTTGVEPAYLVFCHTDCEHDIRLLPGFKETTAYGSRKLVHEMEIGSVGRFRFIVSPELGAYADSGAAVGSTGLYSTTGTSIDVYPVIVVAKDAWGEIALRGLDSFDYTNLKPGQKDKNDPLGQRGYVGAKFWSAARMLNQGWMAVAEVGITALS